jgi:hypothetical protein
MSYRPQHYKIHELVHPLLLNEFGEAKCWEFLDADLLFMADAIRDKYGVITVNAGELVDCGLRDWRNPATGSSTSAHCHGKGFDLHILAIPQTVEAYEEVRAELLADAKFQRLCFETGVNWLHVDISNREYRTFAG